MTRRDFIAGGALAALGTMARRADAAEPENVLAVWQRDTDAVAHTAYNQYFADGQTRGLVSLEKLDRAFENMLAEIKTVQITDKPAVWMVYNMGVVVKTRKALFSIDLVHRRAPELAPLLDFALITHNHDDHYRPEFYRALDRAGKTVASNFLDNYGVRNWNRDGGFTRARKIFKIKDVEIATSLTDHNNYLVDFTTAFEIKVGAWRMLHTGDCSNVQKLNPIWGRPDLWVFFPGCGVDVAAGERRIRPALTAYGHLWELGHAKWRLTTPMVERARRLTLAEGGTVTIPLWGDRIV